MEDGEDRGESPLISSSTGRVIPPAWLREAGGSVPTLKISHVHWAQATTLPPSVDDPGGILGEWKTHPTHGRDGGGSSWEGQVRVGVGEGEQRESQRMTLVWSIPPIQTGTSHPRSKLGTPNFRMEKGMAPQPSILAWRIPWTEEPGGLQSMRSQRVKHDQTTN